MASTITGEHSKYSASSAHRWMECPGSMAMCKGIADKPSKYSAEGTVAHDLAATCADANEDPFEAVGEVVQADGFSFTIDQEMAGHVNTWLLNVAEYVGTRKPIVLTEQRVYYNEALDVERDEAFGTLDKGIVYDDEIGVHDLKYGQGDIVFAVDNHQMQLYALGLMQEYDALLDIKKITMAIHQPRVKKAPSEWSISVEDLKAFGAKAREAVTRVKIAEIASESGRQDKTWQDAYLNPGAKTCRWCRAKATCPALRSAVLTTVAGHAPAATGEFEDLTFKPKDHVRATDSEWLSAAMKMTPLVEEWLKAVRAEVESRVLQGVPVPGFKVVMGKQGNRAWVDLGEAEKALKAMRLKVEEMYDLTLISPTSAEKLFKLKVIGPRQWPALQSQIHRAPGVPHVAPESDARQAIAVQPTASEFEDVTLNENVQSIADELG